MGNKHPAPMLLTDESVYPIHTTAAMFREYAELMAKRADEAQHVLKFLEQIEAVFRQRVDDCPPQAVRIYDFVKGVCLKEDRTVETQEIVDSLKNQGVPTGIRGNLSRLVRDGILLRPKVGHYWPADVLYER